MSIGRKVWKWIDRDLYDSRPWSTALFMVPFVPAIIAQQISASPQIEGALLLLGTLLGFGWLTYVIYRRIKHAARATRLTIRRGKEDVSSVCPVCLTELFDPPETERFKFGGWTCPTCDTELDRYAKEIH